MMGIAYFTDGHTEDITMYRIYDNDIVEFWTPSGKYCHRTYYQYLGVYKPALPSPVVHCYEYEAKSFYREVTTLFGRVDWAPASIIRIELCEK